MRLRPPTGGGGLTAFPRVLAGFQWAASRHMRGWRTGEGMGETEGGKGKEGEGRGASPIFFYNLINAPNQLYQRAMKELIINVLQSPRVDCTNRAQVKSQVTLTTAECDLCLG